MIKFLVNYFIACLRAFKAGVRRESPFFFLALFNACWYEAVRDDLGDRKADALAAEAVRRFGHVRGYGVARSANEAGLPRTREAFFACYDMKIDHEKDLRFQGDVLEVVVHDCEFRRASRRMLVERSAVRYCREFDPAVVAGFDGDFIVEHEPPGPCESGPCILRYKKKEK